MQTFFYPIVFQYDFQLICLLLWTSYWRSHPKKPITHAGRSHAVHKYVIELRAFGIVKSLQQLTFQFIFHFGSSTRCLWTPELTPIINFCTGSFNNYVDQLLLNFDHLPPSSRQLCTFYIPPSVSSLEQAWTTTYLPTSFCSRSN